jgi:hypothetical protein
LEEYSEAHERVDFKSSIAINPSVSRATRHFYVLKAGLPEKLSAYLLEARRAY